MAAGVSGWVVTLVRSQSGSDGEGKAVVGVEQWAEVRRMKRVEGLSVREISRRTGVARETGEQAVGGAGAAALLPGVGGVDSGPG